MEESNKLAKIAHENGLGDVSTHLWGACVEKVGVGTKEEMIKCNKDYAEIMSLILKKLKRK